MLVLGDWLMPVALDPSLGASLLKCCPEYQLAFLLGCAAKYRNMELLIILF